MTFLGWTFLFGTLAVAGPLMAHLLAKPRFRRLPFTMLQFLRSSQAESYSRRHLRDLLMLLLRCAVIVLIALLFARPILFIKPGSNDRRHIYYLGLDNSTSMSYTDGSSSYFEQMKDSAIERIVSAEADAVFNLCPLVSGNWIQGLTKQQALAEVKALKITTGSADVDTFVSGINNSIRTGIPDDKISVVLFSDFTPQILKQFLNVQESSPVDNLSYETIVSPKPINNASIVHARAVDSSADGLTINVSVANQGQIRQNRQLTAKIKTDKSVSREVELLPNQVKTYSMKIDTGFGSGRQLFVPVDLSLSSGDGLKADDTYYLAVRLPQKKQINVLLAEANEDEMFLLDTAIQTLSGGSSERIVRVRRVMVGDLSSSSLDGVDVLFCSGVVERLSPIAMALSGFLKAGGRVVFFITGEPASGALNQLWQLGVLPALPKKFIQEQTYAGIRPCERQFSGVDDIAAKALSNYRIDRIPLTGYWDCQPHPESRCLWRFQNGMGFIYFRQVGHGASILMNTSADGSLGSLTKSAVAIALCRYLLGEHNLLQDYSFICNERVVLPVGDIVLDSNRQKSLWVQSCDGEKSRAVLTDSSIVLPDPGGVGWIKSLTEPELYAGVNLPSDETDMSKPALEEVDDALKRIFSIGKRGEKTFADSVGTREQMPVWKILVWTIIVLLLLESALANRLRR